MGKAFEKQTKTIKDQGEKQVNASETLKLKELKSKVTKSKETKPVEYDNYFLNGWLKYENLWNQIIFMI